MTIEVRGFGAVFLPGRDVLRRVLSAGGVMRRVLSAGGVMRRVLSAD